MAYIHKGMQGKIGEVKYNGQLVREIHVYINSSDFPDCQMIMMPQADNQHQTERVPITEELWQKIGECLGYKFKRYSEKGSRQNHPELVEKCKEALKSQ